LPGLYNGVGHHIRLCARQKPLSIQDQLYILYPLAICDYLAKDVGILRQSCSEEKNGNMFRLDAVKGTLVTAVYSFPLPTAPVLFYTRSR
jgi:hypothetical protein